MHDHRYAEQLLARLKEWTNCSEHIKARHRTSARSAHTLAVPQGMETLLPAGITQLYTHQHQVLQAALHGQSITVATATAPRKPNPMTLPSPLTPHHSP